MLHCKIIWKICDNLCAFPDYFQPVEIMRTNSVMYNYIYSHICVHIIQNTHKVIFRNVRYIAWKSGTDRISLSKTLVDLPHFYGWLLLDVNVIQQVKIYQMMNIMPSSGFQFYTLLGNYYLSIVIQMLLMHRCDLTKTTIDILLYILLYTLH